MKKNLFLRLCLMMAVVLSAFSCRQDILHEQETYNNSGAFQLTSKRISLSEAQHKAKLLPELEQVEKKFKTFSTTNAQGKIVSYGNGVSIDTDLVTYIENGPNFHTYTFNLTRENALPTDPVENLILIPTTIGTYRELLVSYHVTPQEKQMLMNGENVDTKDRSTVIVLENNTYNPLSGKSGGQSCVWAEAIVGYTACSENAHFNAEGSDQCDAKIKSQAIKEFFLRCENIYDGTETGGGGEWWVGSGGGTDSGTGGEPLGPGNPEPCNGNGVATNPLEPNTNIGEGGCSGIPTVITVPEPQEPACKQLSALKNKTGFTEKMTTLKNNIESGTKEKGFILHDDATTPTSNVIEGGSPYDPADVNFEPYYENLWATNQSYLYKAYGSAHNHLKNNPNHIGVPTPEDFNQLVILGILETSAQNPNQKPTPEKAIVLVTTKIGLFALKINDFVKMKAYISKYMLWSNKQKEKYIKDNFFNRKKYNIFPTSTHDEQVTGFLRFLQDMEVGADIYEGNPTNNGEWKKLNLVENTNGTYSYTQTPCTL